MKYTPSEIYETAKDNDLEVQDTKIDENLHILEVNETLCDHKDCHDEAHKRTLCEFESTDGEQTYELTFCYPETDEELMELFNK